MDGPSDEIGVLGDRQVGREAVRRGPRGIAGKKGRRDPGGAGQAGGKRASGSCGGQRKRYGLEEPEDGGRAFFAPGGCEAREGEGYSGRIGLYDLMPMQEEIVALSLERSSAGEISRAAVRAGMVKMRADGLLKTARGITPVEEVLRITVP